MDNQQPQTIFPEPVVPVAPVSVAEPKSNFPVMYLVLLLLCIILLGSTAFLYYQNMQLKNMLTSYQNQPVASPIPFVSPEPTAQVKTQASGLTANWKTFTDINYNFSFKYPNTWTSTTCNLENTLLLNPKSGGIECATEPQEPIQISVSATYQKVDDYVKSWEKSGFKATLESSNLPNGGLKYSILKVGPAPGPEKFTEILLQLNKAILVIDINDPNQETTADQILSTFKFTN